VLLIGKPGSGKSSLLYNLFHHEGRDGTYKQAFDRVWYFSPSETVSWDLPPERVFPAWDLETIANIVHDEDSKLKDHCMIFDDCISEIKDGEHSKFVFKTFANRRHTMFSKAALKKLKLRNLERALRRDDVAEGVSKEDVSSDEEEKNGSLTLMVVTQRYNIMPKKLRAQISHAFIFEPTPTEADDLYKELISKLMDKEEWFQLIEYVYHPKEAKNFLLVDFQKGKLYKNWNEIEIVRSRHHADGGDPSLVA